MAVGALFGDVGMFVDERALVLHVATRAKGLGGNTFEVAFVG